MEFPEYIDEIGIAAMATKYKVRRSTVYMWRRGERRPRANTAVQIAKDSGGRMPLAKIITSAVEKP